MEAAGQGIERSPAGSGCSGELRGLPGSCSDMQSRERGLSTRLFCPLKPTTQCHLPASPAPSPVSSPLNPTPHPQLADYRGMGVIMRAMATCWDLRALSYSIKVDTAETTGLSSAPRGFLGEGETKLNQSLIGGFRRDGGADGTEAF
ncbi:hypothetical protein JZ751_021087 [Albula glossodonta]|uniref:Uncharacterized protein n=1 Tax=Albula glossodonta TaxID=121402 RepID=A0A8T2PH63_9TELE|nr:hypothetical protein JZ751_021087 [Albula glossodonta]